MRTIKNNTVYRHFKEGNEYIVLGVSYPKEVPEANRVIKAEHTETGKDIFICKPFEEFSHWGLYEKGKLVVYMALYGDYKVYARPYDMFISEMEIGRTSDYNMIYRFEQVPNIPLEPIPYRGEKPTSYEPHPNDFC